MTPLDYCRDKAAQPGSDFHYALFFTDRDRQPALLALAAFRTEVLGVADEVREQSVAAVKLKWWRDELERAFAGTARHPVSQALQEPLRQLPLAREHFDELLQAAEMDLEYGSYPTFNALSLYCHRAGTSYVRLLAEAQGYRDSGAVARYAHDLGMGITLMDGLQNIRANAQRGRCYIPEDELQQAGVSQNDLLQARSSEPLRALFAQQAERVEAFFDQALQHLEPRDRYAQRSGIILLELQRDLLREMREEGFPLLEREFHLTPLRRLWIAWRTQRRLKRHKGSSR